MEPDEEKCLLSQTIRLASDQDVDVLRRSLFNSAFGLSNQILRVPRQGNVYTCGDEDRMIYCIQHGHIKLVVDSIEGKECLLDIYSSGDFFGESCLADLGFRLETAIAMDDTILRRVSCQQFIASLSSAELYGLIKRLNKRILEQQLFITDMVTMSSEFRLGKLLLRLGSRLGKKHSSGTIINCRISQEELSQMIGTTRPRVTEFISKFRRLGLVNLNMNRLITIKEADLMHYLSSIM
ncbi:MAG TPA: Crp/Fnr family transcriptional regulator [Pyrinomonadaceae bacterium]|nr:Crp/Fnr family transcriptional regulator [Pyrinomonadaceae bacterium]